MASAFGHALVPLALGSTFKPDWKVLITGVILSALPDIDSVGFLFGVPYNSFWGHRGFSHSILFSVLIALACVAIFFRKRDQKAGLFLFFFCSSISHALLDAMTTGGLGVAFFPPFNNERYFFPFRPIKVSPINVKLFFEGKGIAVLKSEMIWIGIPAAALIISSTLARFLIKKRKPGVK